MRFLKRPKEVAAVVWVGEPANIEADWVKDCIRVGKIYQTDEDDGGQRRWMVRVVGGEQSVSVGDFVVADKGHLRVLRPGEFFANFVTYPDSRTCDANRKQFEDEAYIEYLTEETMVRSTQAANVDPNVRTMTPEQFNARKPDGTYATKMLNAAWWAWQRAREVPKPS